mmetsp:Transcript_164190/g.526555  ORF Transcript_164190/g.526555 Transcript_164190/m.526555 type:complete len:201 (+) Transcript_164190:203-805(+)
MHLCVEERGPQALLAGRGSEVRLRGHAAQERQAAPLRAPYICEGLGVFAAAVPGHVFPQRRLGHGLLQLGRLRAHRTSGDEPRRRALAGDRGARAAALWRAEQGEHRVYGRQHLPVGCALHDPIRQDLLGCVRELEVEVPLQTSGGGRRPHRTLPDGARTAVAQGHTHLGDPVPCRGAGGRPVRMPRRAGCHASPSAPGH